MQENIIRKQMMGGVEMGTTTVEGFSMEHEYYLRVRKPIYKKEIINSFIVKHLANRAENTRIAYKSTLSNFLDAMPKEKDGEIILDGDSIRTYFYSMQNLTDKIQTYPRNKKSALWNKASTRRVRLMMIRKFLFFLFKEQYAENDFSGEVNVPRKIIVAQYTPSDTKISEFFTALNNLYKKEKERLKFYTIFKMYALTGFRKMEAVNLNYDDIDFERSTIYLRNTKSTENDTFPIGKQLKQLLSNYIDEFKVTDGPLFRGKCGKNGIIRIYDSVVERNFNKIKKLADLPAGFTIQSIRRYAIDRWRRNGADIYTLKKLARHRDINTTYLYCNVKDEELMDVLDKKDFDF